MAPLVKENDDFVVYCDRCGEKMRATHCKMSCQNCGAVVDCSDY